MPITDWQVKISQSRGAPYFFNTKTKESTWTAPAELSEDEVNTMLSELQASRPSNGQVRASHLLVKHSGSRRPASWKEPNITRTKDEAIEILRGYQTEIGTSAEKFGELASVHSDCSSHAQNGDLVKKRISVPTTCRAFGLAVELESDASRP
uniref:Peptidyl-prolyl cis-trans isomerase n=1 Tax=Mycena chlorophos TaxID=658473 RepID=A0ABQ0MAF8_MYCCL|nr:predicted protein [Mycena chlorophos]